MSKQTEAQRLAADLNGIFVSEEVHASKAAAIAAELLRQEALIAELAGVAELLIDANCDEATSFAVQRAHAALAKVQQ